MNQFYFTLLEVAYLKPTGICTGISINHSYLKNLEVIEQPGLEGGGAGPKVICKISCNPSHPVIYMSDKLLLLNISCLIPKKRNYFKGKNI